MSNLFKHELQRLPGPRRNALARHDLLIPCAPQQLVSLLIDKSLSMSGPPIEQVNRGVADFTGDLADDPLTRETLQVQLVTFGGKVTVRPFVPISRFTPPLIEADGLTPMAEAILKAIQATERHTEFLGRAAEVDVLKPHYFVFSDGAPTSPSELLKEAAAEVRRSEQTGRGAFYGFGVNQAAVKALQPLFARRVHLLGEQNFAEFFRILSVSVRRVSSTCVSEDCDLTPVIDNLLRIADSRNDDA